MKRLTAHAIARACQEDDRLAPQVRKRKPAGNAPALPDEPIAPVGPMPRLHFVEGAAPVRAWTQHLEAAALRQLGRMASLPIVHPHGLAVMPDVQPGNGACVGSVLPLRGALVPSAVGLDAGCGMVAVQLDLRATQLPDNLRHLRHAIEAAVPVGTGGIHEETVDAATWLALEGRYQQITERHPQLHKRTADRQLGTLGAGNHFIELCLDTTGGVWVMIHSGSRGAGAQIGQYFILKAQQYARTNGIELPDRALAWLPEGTPGFDDYERALLWAQDYARENRKVMLTLTLQAIGRTLGKSIRVLGEAVSCHHNYAARETHFGEDLWITRKGAIRAGVGEWGIIPGSMGTQSFIVRGKGATEAYCSCSHGAGRRMSRDMARQSFTVSDLRKQTAGIECRKDRAVVDEIPGAYKDIRQVMAEQSDLVEVVHTLRQIVCVKGS